MICPRCNNNLVLSNTQGVEIDYCPGCRGVWLDRGELEKIIERTNSFSLPNQIENQNYNHHDDHHEKIHDDHHEYGQYPKRKKGFLSELFDF